MTRGTTARSREIAAAGAGRAQDQGDADRAPARPRRHRRRPRSRRASRSSTTCWRRGPSTGSWTSPWTPRATSRWISTTRWRTWGSASARRSARRWATSGASCATARPSCPWTRRCCTRRWTSRAGRTSSSTCRSSARGSSNFDLDLLEEFFRAFAFNAEITLHVTMHYGENLHHIAEAVFKAVGRALAEAHPRSIPRIAGHPLRQGQPVSGPATCMIAIVDYGRGNLGSVEKAFAPPRHARGRDPGPARGRRRRGGGAARRRRLPRRHGQPPGARASLDPLRACLDERRGRSSASASATSSSSRRARSSARARGST